mgnify:CR=1 FL=1
MLYETEENKSAEDKLRTALGDAYGYNMVALPIKYSLDCIAYNGKEAKCFFEFKCRTVASTEYDTALVNLHKAWMRIAPYTGCFIYRASSSSN